jgi:glycine cleavage system regulatory protein
MSQQLIITISAEDRPGIIRDISKIVLEHQGNWLDSSFSKLAGKFTGILLVSISNKNAASLKKDLLELSTDNFTLRVDNSSTEEFQSLEHAAVSIVGNDRPGIVDEIAALLAANKVNVVKFESRTESSPMSSGLLFVANLEIELAGSEDFTQLQSKLESLSAELMVEICAA